MKKKCLKSAFENQNCSFLVAGSTSLILLILRLVVSHVLIPQINKIDAVHTLEGSNGNGNGKEPSPTMQLAVKGLRLFDTLASIFSTIWLIVGKHFCLLMLCPSIGPN